MMGRQMSKGSVLKTAPMTEKNSTTTVERSSAQILKQPQKKKRIPRLQIKVRQHSRRRPAKSPAQQKLRKGRNHSTRNLNVCKRMANTQSQETRLKTCYCSFSGTLAKFPLESSLRIAPPKAPKKPNPGRSNSSGVKAEERNPSAKQVGKVETLQPPLAETPEELSSTRENQRKSKPTIVGKRRYQAVSEFQFIYPPGKATFHCSRETVKQQLRSIYLSNQKQIKQNWTSQSQSDGNMSQRGNSHLDAKCPVGSEFLKSMQTSLMPHGLSSLTYKINKLVLVSENPQAAPPKAPHTLEIKQHPPQVQHPLASDRPSLTAEALQRPIIGPERKMSQEGCHVDQGCSPDVLLQENASMASCACCAQSPKPRPLSAKDCYMKVSDPTLGERNQHVACPEKEDAAQSTLDLGANRNRATAHAESAIALLRISQLPSNEGFGREMPPNVSFLTEARQPGPPHAALEASKEKLAGCFASHPCEGKGQVYSFGAPQSRNPEPSRMDTWRPRTQESLQSCSD